MSIEAIKKALNSINILYKHQYIGSRDAMAALRSACDDAWNATKQLRQITDKSLAVDHQLKPLTLHEIYKIMTEVQVRNINEYEKWLVFARAIEKAHSIKGEE